MPLDPDAFAKRCAELYDHPMVRQLLGESLHPGGIDLTAEVARTAGIAAGARVLDAGCGRGASAIYLAGKLGCRVTGITLEKPSIIEATEQAARRGVQDLTAFHQGDLAEFPLEADAFDTVLMECVLSALPQKELVLRRLLAAARPGGRLVVTDVTIASPLPREVEGALALIGCNAGAGSLSHYADLVTGQGFSLDSTTDLPRVIPSLLESISGKLKMAELAAAFGMLSVDGAFLSEAKRVLVAAQAEARREALSYGFLVATRPATPSAR